MKCLVEQPDAVVVDLGETVVATPAALSVLLVVARQAAFWPDTPLMLAVPDSRMAEKLGHQHARMPIFPSVDDALDAEPDHHTHALGEVLLPAMGAARRARYLAVEACSRWELRGLAPTASIVASELVANAVKHAATMTDLRFTLGRRFLIIAVRDGSSAPPRIRAEDLEEASTARGLLLVAELAHRWGSAPTEGGKVVWAALRRPPPARDTF